MCILRRRTKFVKKLVHVTDSCRVRGDRLGTGRNALWIVNLDSTLDMKEVLLGYRPDGEGGR